MTQEQWIILTLKIFCLSGFVSLTGWVALYTRYARWWRDAIGRTLVVKTTLIAMLLIPTALSLFFRFNGPASLVAGWVDTGLIAAITPVMLWRIAIWQKIHRTATPRLPQQMQGRIAELEAENAALRQQLEGRP